ncbi:Uncharacterised protein [uncultured archaeon]|nr:Uncharacterised protein [uncultured archaeon]
MLLFEMNVYELPKSPEKAKMAAPKKSFFSRHWKPLVGGLMALSALSYFQIKGCNDSFYAPKEQKLREEYGYNIADDSVRKLAKLQVERGLSAKEVLRLTRIRKFVQGRDSINALFERNLPKTGITCKDMEPYFNRTPLDEEMVARTLSTHKDVLDAESKLVQRIVDFANRVKGGRYDNEVEKGRMLAIIAILQGARMVSKTPSGVSQ